jgi:uncharacterized protein
MHYTLHLTDACNLSCRYCYVRQSAHFMTTETARATVDLASKSGRRCGIIFFGGEPLLCRDLIYSTVAYAESVQARSDVKFHYKITTNGLLLDDEFLEFSLKHDVFIALSHDGVKAANDRNRVTKNGEGSYDKLEAAARKLLRSRPYAPVLTTVSCNTVQYYAESVKHLFSLGFRYLICSIDYAGAWDEKSLAELKRQYKKLAAFYKDLTLKEEKFYLSPFEVKISSHIRGDDYCAERCELGKKQISVAPDGRLYPCVQFVGDDEYAIGDVRSGIDQAKRLRLYELNENEKESCADCAVKGRCNQHCACLNKQSTGDFRRVSPVLCAHERILLPIADALAEDLYKRRSGLFIQKQYNDMFPLLSLTEDRLLTRDHF